MPSLTIKNEQISYRDILQKLEECKNLSSLTLENLVVSGSSDDVFDLSRFFRGHEDLKSISFRQVKTGDAEADLSQILSTLLVATYNLTDLTVDESDFSMGSLKCIAYAPNLETLHLANNDLKDEDAVAIADALSKSKTITSVDLSNNDLTDFGCHAFKDALKTNNHVNSLNLDGNSQITLEGRSSLESQVKLAKAA